MFVGSVIIVYNFLLLLMQYIELYVQFSSDIIMKCYLLACVYYIYIYIIIIVYIIYIANLLLTL